MSFNKVKDIIDYGDTALLYVGYDNMLPIIVTEGKVHQTKFGSLKHDKLVGLKYGSRLQCPNGWINVVHPNPELWTLSLPHRTQILYSTDISMIIFQLDLKPGSVVVEAGTGSGSLSHAILRTIQPSGHLHTFEFHKERSIKAQEEFIQHGLGSFVTVTHRDVCVEGFPCDHLADAVFLDLPKPWECIASAKSALKKEGGRICTFSPCIEQVQCTHEALGKEGFEDISTLECLNRNFNLQYAKMQNVSFDEEFVEQPPDQVSSLNDSSDQTEQLSTLPTKGEFRIIPKKSDNGVSVEDKNKNDSNSKCFPAAVPIMNMQGHTGFLTFATLSLH